MEITIWGSLKAIRPQEVTLKSPGWRKMKLQNEARSQPPPIHLPLPSGSKLSRILCFRNNGRDYKCFMEMKAKCKKKLIRFWCLLQRQIMKLKFRKSYLRFERTNLWWIRAENQRLNYNLGISDSMFRGGPGNPQKYLPIRPQNRL